MYKLKKNVVIIFTVALLLICSCVSVNAANNGSNEVKSSTTNENEVINKDESAASTLVDIKEEQLRSIEDYKAKYGSDTYGMVAYILHLVQIYSIPLGLVGIAFCAIYEYVIGLKRLDIRDKGFNTMIAVVTIIIICQILPLIFAVVVKSTD